MQCIWYRYHTNVVAKIEYHDTQNYMAVLCMILFVSGAMVMGQALPASRATSKGLFSCSGNVVCQCNVVVAVRTSLEAGKASAQSPGSGGMKVRNTTRDIVSNIIGLGISNITIFGLGISNIWIFGLGISNIWIFGLGISNITIFGLGISNIASSINRTVLAYSACTLGHNFLTGLNYRCGSPR